MMFAKQEGVPVDEAALHERTRRQWRGRGAAGRGGIDVVSDGETGKPSYVSYIGRPARRLRRHSLPPALGSRRVPGGAEASVRRPGPARAGARPACNGPVRSRDGASRAPTSSKLPPRSAGDDGERGFITPPRRADRVFFGNTTTPRARSSCARSPRRCGPSTRRSSAPASCCSSTARTSAMGGHSEFADRPLEDFRARCGCTSKRSTRRRRTSRPSGCACTSAGATTRVRTTTTCRSPTSSTWCSRRARRRSRSRRRTRGTSTSGRCSSRSSCRTARC